MNDFLDKYTFEIGDAEDTPFTKANGIRQDGTTPMYRDTDGKLWAMSGHSHLGHIAMFSGTSVDDLEQLYPINTNFCVGHADYAFDGIRYPDGTKARGSIWPFGLYICPGTHRFFCFFHNETGWNGKGTAYDAYGYCDVPHYDFDFRHIGLMHSDDEGKNWTFDRWVITGERPAFTEGFKPTEAGIAVGQKMGKIQLGGGDFSLFVNPNDEYIYLIYNMANVDTDSGKWEECNAYIARTRKRDDGIMGDFVKYYNGAFCEPGNFGKETVIARDTWHPRIVYLEKYDTYLMSGTRLGIKDDGNFGSTLKTVLSTSSDLVNWTEQIYAPTVDGKVFGNHYVAIRPTDKTSHANVISDDDFCFLTNHNATDVKKFKTKVIKK